MEQKLMERLDELKIKFERLNVLDGSFVLIFRQDAALRMARGLLGALPCEFEVLRDSDRQISVQWIAPPQDSSVYTEMVNRIG